MKPGIDFIGIGVVFFCHDGKGNVLMSRRNSNARNENGRWDIGGGKLELGESVEDALVREIKEEYLTDVEEKEFLGFRDVFDLVGKEGVREETHWIVLDFKVLVDREKSGNGEPHKFDDVQWFPIGNFPTPLHSQLPTFLAKYADRL